MVSHRLVKKGNTYMGQDFSVVAETISVTKALALGNGVNMTLASGNTVLSSGNLTLTAGNETLTAGNLTLTSGNLTVSTGSLSLDGAQITTNGSGFIGGGGAASATVSVATAVNTTIPIATRLVRVSASAVTTSGSCTLAVGTLDGEYVTLLNESSNNIIISGNMQAATETVSANKAGTFIWIAADTKWFHSV